MLLDELRTEHGIGRANGARETSEAREAIGRALRLDSALAISIGTG